MRSPFFLLLLLCSTMAQVAASPMNNDSDKSKTIKAFELVSANLDEATVEVFDASCGDSCDGMIAALGGGDGPWDYILNGSDGSLLYFSNSVAGPDTITGLCPGLYDFRIVDTSTDEVTLFQVVVGAGPVPEILVDYTLPCYEGEAINLRTQITGANGEITYQWSGPNGFSSILANPLALYSGTYTLEVSVDGCAADAYTFEIPSLDEVDVVAIEQDTVTACPGDSLTLVAGGLATNFTWVQLDGDGVLGQDSTLQIEPVDGDVYIVFGRTDNNCFGSDTVVVSMTFSASLVVAPEGVSCAGDTINLSVSDGTSFLWSTGDTTSSIAVAPASTQNYSVTVTGGDCSSVFSTTQEVAAPSFFLISPGISICVGESVTLGAAGGEYMVWSTGDTTFLLAVSPEVTTTYTATQINQYGCAQSKSVTVTVNPAPELELLPADTTICAGDTVQLQLFEAGNLVWDSLVAPSQSQMYPLPSDYGCLADQPSFSVTVAAPPSLSIAGGGTFCTADSLLLIADSNGTLLWSTGEDSDSIYVSPDSMTVYSVTATNAFGCTASDSVTVNASAPPPAPAIICEPGFNSLSFSWVVEPGLTYGLSMIDGSAGMPVGNNTYIVEGLAPGQSVSILLTAEDSAGCSSSSTATCAALSCDAIELTIAAPEGLCTLDGLTALSATVSGGSGMGSGAWSGIGIDSSGQFFDPALAGPGIFELVFNYEDAGCVLSDTSLIQVEQALEDNQLSCIAGPDYLEFVWPASPQDTAYEAVVLSGQEGLFTGPTAYRVDSLSLGDTVSVAITAFGQGICGNVTITGSCVLESFVCPDLAIAPDTFICRNGTAQLWADSLQWDRFEWSPAAGLSCTDCPAPKATLSSTTTTYQLIASSANGCTDTASVTVFIETFPDAYVPDEVVFCPGEPVELCMPAGNIYYWIGPNAFVETGQCLDVTDPMPGNYYAFMRTSQCRFIKPFQLRAAPQIELETFTEFQAACANDTFELKASSPQAISYHWNPEEYLSCPDCPVTTGSVPQTATFVLSVQDTFGCSLEAQAVVFIDDCDPAPRPGTSPSPMVQGLKVFPNPASTEVQVLTAAEGVKQLEVWNAAGRLALRQSFAGQQWALSVDGLPAGSYFLRLVSDSGVESTRLLVGH